MYGRSLSVFAKICFSVHGLIKVSVSLRFVRVCESYRDFMQVMGFMLVSSCSSRIGVHEFCNVSMRFIKVLMYSL